MAGPRLLLVALALLPFTGCSREKRELRVAPPERAVLTATIRDSNLQPGGPLPEPTFTNPYNGNAYAISEGQRLFDWYNCVGCHAHGGGAIGPSLMEKTMRYGNEPANIFESIVKGRPNGMPSWGGRIPVYQVWQIVAYVRSLSGEQPRPVVPARSDMLEKKSGTILKRSPAP